MSSLCSSGSSQQNTNQYVDPLGPSSMNGNTASYSSTGGPQMRQGLFNYLNQGGTQTAENYGANAGSAASAAGSNPGFQEAQQLADATMGGDYLGGSPQLTNQMALNTANAEAGAANSNARTQSQYGANGMNFGTAGQEAEQANNAAAAAGANVTNANTLLGNYETQAGYQQNAVNNLATATGTPLNYLNSASSDLTSPLSQIANLVSGLSSGGQVINTGSQNTSTPSTGSDVLNGVSGVMGLLGDL